MLVMLSMSPCTCMTTTFIATTSHWEHAFVHMNFAVIHGITDIIGFSVMMILISIAVSCLQRECV